MNMIGCWQSCFCLTTFIDVHGRNQLIPRQKVPKFTINDHLTYRVTKCAHFFLIFHWFLVCDFFY
jgi:hypothetical protein